MKFNFQIATLSPESRPKKAKVAKKFQNPHSRHATGLAGPKSRGAVRGAMTMPATRRLALLALPLLLGVLTVTQYEAQERARAAQREAAFAQAEI